VSDTRIELVGVDLVAHILLMERMSRAQGDYKRLMEEALAIRDTANTIGREFISALEVSHGIEIDEANVRPVSEEGRMYLDWGAPEEDPSE